MDSADRSAAIIADAGETVMTLLQSALPTLLSADLAGLERQLQALSRVLWGRIVEEVVRVRAAERGRPRAGGRKRSSACGRQSPTGRRPVQRAGSRCDG